MKIIKFLIGYITLFALIFIVVSNFSEILYYSEKLFKTSREVIISPSNEYKRNFKFEKYTVSDDFEPENKNDIENIYFNILNNGWDKFTFYCPYEYELCIEDISDISNDQRLLSDLNNYVHPYNSFKLIDTTISSMGEVNINIKKNYSEEEINRLNVKVNDIMDSLDFNKLSLREKLLKIHNYIIKNTKYDQDMANNRNTKYKSDTAIGTLFDGYAVCSGYSDTMALFLDILGLPNIKVSTDNHVWNLVHINSEWLHIDLTWDDYDTNISSKIYFFLITTKELLKLDQTEHSFDQNFFIEGK